MADSSEDAKAWLKERIKHHFTLLVQGGLTPQEAAVQAVSAARQEASVTLNRSAQPQSSPVPVTPPAPPLVLPQPPAELSPPSPHAPSPVRPGQWGEVPNIPVPPPTLTPAQQKYGPLCLALAGPFESICVVGTPRTGKKLLVLDIDHTLYDPSEHGGTNAATISATSAGLYDESVVARCRPGLHEFLTAVYAEYDIMVWSASRMSRILTLLQQIGLLPIHPTASRDYEIMAVLDKYSMSERTDADADPPPPPEASEGDRARGDSTSEAGTSMSLVQTITVPEGALPGQLIEVESMMDGSAMVVTVPPGHGPGAVFYVTPPGALSSVSKEVNVDRDELQLALQMSMGEGEAPPPDADTAAPDPAPGPPKATASPEIQRARKRRRYIKPLSLVWACREFQRYSEQNTVIVDDTLDVCGANPHNFIQCTRYLWANHATDAELPRLAVYLTNIAKAPRFPTSHENWRQGL